jgi:hypothetical protein
MRQGWRHDDNAGTGWRHAAAGTGTPMNSVSLPEYVRRCALCLFLCIALAGCEFIQALTQPSWPSKEALEAFDFRPIESDPAIRAMDQVYYYYGASYDCNFVFDSDPAFAKFLGIGAENLGRPVGHAASKLIAAEVERRHPGYPGNQEFAEWLFRSRSVKMWKQGHAAFAASSCDAMRPRVRSAVLEVLEFSLSLRAGNDKPDAKGGEAEPAPTKTISPE